MQPKYKVEPLVWISCELRHDTAVAVNRSGREFRILFPDGRLARDKFVREQKKFRRLAAKEKK